MNRLTSSMLAALGLAAALTTVTAQAQDAKGNAQDGAKKAAMCMGCHNIPGYQASFPEVHKVPKISGQDAGYITAALTEYKKGERKHPTMRAVAGSLSDQDIADLAAFYSQRGMDEPMHEAQAEKVPADVAALLEKGACTGCHGANFSKPVVPGAPKIAGQHADYLYVALKAYQTDGNPQVGRANPIMAGQVKQLSHAELKAIANYISTLPSDLKTEPESRFR
jgi:cytochrome c553